MLDLIIEFIVSLWLLRYTCVFAGMALCRLYTERRIKKSRFKSEQILEIKVEDHGLKEKKNLEWISGFLRGVMKYEVDFTGRIPSHKVRIWIYRNIFRMPTEERVVIYKGLTAIDLWKIKIGKGSIIGDDNMLDGRGEIVIGENVNLSSQVRIWTGQHDVQGKNFEYVDGKVTIGDRAWISGNTTILPGITIGEGAVVASGAVVTKNVEPYGIYGGVPAVKIGTRTKDLEYSFGGSHDWFL